jgi:hypothetical protein
MQMTMTFSFDDAGEASVFFSEMATLFSRTGSTIANLLKTTAAPTQEKVPVDLNTPATQVETAPETTEAVAEKASEEPKRRGRPRGSAKQKDGLEEALENIPAKPAAPAEPAADTFSTGDRREISVDLLRELAQRVVKRTGDSAAVYKAMAKHGVERMADLSETQRYEVWGVLRQLDIDDEIPF